MWWSCILAKASPALIAGGTVFTSFCITSSRRMGPSLRASQRGARAVPARAVGGPEGARARLACARSCCAPGARFRGSEARLLGLVCAANGAAELVVEAAGIEHHL